MSIYPDTVRGDDFIKTEFNKNTAKSDMNKLPGEEDYVCVFEMYMFNKSK